MVEQRLNKQRALALDLDGTVADSMPALTELAVPLIAQGYQISLEYARHCYEVTQGAPFLTQLIELFPASTLDFHQAIANLFENKKRQLWSTIQLFPDAVELIRYCLDTDVQVSICSSTDRALVISLLARFDPRWPSSLTILGNQGGDDKARQLMTVPGLYFIGDSLRDLSYALTAGKKFIGIGRTQMARYLFAKEGLPSVASLMELPGVLEWLNEQQSAPA